MVFRSLSPLLPISTWGRDFLTSPVPSMLSNSSSEPGTLSDASGRDIAGPRERQSPAARMMGVNETNTGQTTSESPNPLRDVMYSPTTFLNNTPIFRAPSPVTFGSTPPPFDSPSHFRPIPRKVFMSTPQLAEEYQRYQRHQEQIHRQQQENYYRQHEYYMQQMQSYQNQLQAQAQAQAQNQAQQAQFISLAHLPQSNSPVPFMDRDNTIRAPIALPASAVMQDLRWKADPKSNIHSSQESASPHSHTPSPTTMSGSPQLSSMYLPPQYARGSPKKKPCNCKQSKCLKLYCECFAAGTYCQNCNCVSCCNTKENEDLRQEAIKATIKRNPPQQKTIKNLPL